MKSVDCVHVIQQKDTASSPSGPPGAASGTTGLFSVTFLWLAMLLSSCLAAVSLYHAITLKTELEALRSELIYRVRARSPLEQPPVSPGDKKAGASVSSFLQVSAAGARQVSLRDGCRTEISVLLSGETRSPSHAEEDPAFLRSTDPDSLRSAGRCGIAPPPPTPSRSARGAVREREPPSSLPTAPSGLPAEHGAEFSRREDGETFRGPPGPGSGETPRCPPPHARPALRAAHLRTPRRHRSVRRRQQPALFQTSAFPGSGAAPPAPSRGVRVGELPAGGPQGARILLPSPRSARPWGELSPPSPP